MYTFFFRMKTKTHARKIKPNLGSSTRPTVQFSKWRRHGFGDSFSYPVLFPSGLSLLTSDAAAAMNKKKRRMLTAIRHLQPPACTSPWWPPGTAVGGGRGGQPSLSCSSGPEEEGPYLPLFTSTTGETNPEEVRLPR